jgi:hypothetical protein
MAKLRQIAATRDQMILAEKAGHGTGQPLPLLPNAAAHSGEKPAS